MEMASQFPVISNRHQDEYPFIYLDNAATCLMPSVVIDEVINYMQNCGANPYRGASVISEQATILCEEARKSIAYFLNAKSHEIIFTKGATEGLNLVADLLELTKEDLVVGTVFEHHANYLPWLMKANYHNLSMNDQGQINLEELEDVLRSKSVKLLSISCASNVTGIIQPVGQAIQLAHQYDVKVCIDAAQFISHQPLNLAQLNPDFLVFSGHKMFAMKGSGVLYINERWHQQLNYQRFGGGMVNAVDDKHISFKKSPLGFEPGTPSVEAIISLSAAVLFITHIGWDFIQKHQKDWSATFLNQLSQSEFELIFPDNTNRLPIFTISKPQSSLDYAWLARILSDSFNMIVNDGQQCCGPLYASVNVDSGLRVSAQIYNTIDQIDTLFSVLKQLSIMM